MVIHIFVPKYGNIYNIFKILLQNNIFRIYFAYFFFQINRFRLFTDPMATAGCSNISLPKQKLGSLFPVKETKPELWLGTNYKASTRNFNCLVKAFSTEAIQSRNKSKRARGLRGLAYLILKLNSILRA